MFFEPVTFAPTERECRTTGIQRRLMELVGHPLAETLFDEQAKVLLRFMPDWHQGGADEAQRLSRRKAVMEEAYQAWPAERVLATWPAVFQALEQPWSKPRHRDRKRQRRASCAVSPGLYLAGRAVETRATSW